MYRIAQHGLCMGRGLCESVARANRISVVMPNNGYQRPVVGGALDHETVDPVYQICPAVRAEGLPEWLSAFGSRGSPRSEAWPKNLRQARGTRKQVRQGNTSEPAPSPTQASS